MKRIYPGLIHGRIDHEDNAAPGGDANGGISSGTFIWLHEESSPLVVAGGGALGKW